ncbi:MAG: protease complex subunit PrcB family protein [Candidatus Eisenbacteria bacterium]|nr:protease complex subunit PrcB family protein [Candidatus Eisenbacteria bacterium]
MSRSLPLITAAVLLLSGCPGDGTRPGAPILVTRITPDAPRATYHSALHEPLRTACFDEAGFAELWNRAFADRGTVPAPPAVDFAREFVVVAALGERSSGGYAIEISGALLENGAVVVGVLSTSPGKNCPVTLALTQPLDIVRLARPNDGPLPVRFEEKSVITSCGS